MMQRAVRKTGFVRLGDRWVQALEPEIDRWFLWFPVFFAAGILFYFSLSSEPNDVLTVAGVVAAVGVFLVMRHTPLGFALGLTLLALSLGFANAKLRTELARAPVLSAELRNVDVWGYVERFEVRAEKRDRLTLRVIGVEDLPAALRPYRVRFTSAAKNTDVRTGEAVIVRATLRAPPDPVEPGGFDFARQAWFKKLGGTGYATGRVRPLAGAAPPPWDLQVWAAIDALRDHVKERIRAVLPGRSGTIAVALVTGDRGGIPQPVTQAMRDSGLAHIFAISGLHMAIMAGSVFFIARALLAGLPGLALRFAIKKWAAMIALIAATFYLALSGATVPTVRAYIMLSIVLIAVMADRPAISMRNVALAALAILVVAPQSLFEPSFQMSFAAVVGLVAFYEWYAHRSRAKVVDTKDKMRPLFWAGAFMAGAAVTTLVAGTAVAPFAVYHFHRLSHFGVVANVISAPLVGLLIMPMALLALIAMPFGLEAWPLQAMGYGIEAMVAVAQSVSSWPGAVSILPSLPGAALVLIAFGGLWLCLWRTRLRVLGLVLVGLGVTLALAKHRPDILIDRDGGTAAIRGSEGDLIFPSAQAANYSIEKWLLSDGDERRAHALPRKSAFHCDPMACTGRFEENTVMLIRREEAIDEACRTADIVIAPFSITDDCGSARIVVDGQALAEQGAHALYIDGPSIRTETAAQRRGSRPWSGGGSALDNRQSGLLGED